MIKIQNKINEVFGELLQQSQKIIKLNNQYGEDYYNRW